MVCGNVGFGSGVPDSAVRREEGCGYATPPRWGCPPRVPPWHEVVRLVKCHPVLHSIPEHTKANVGIVYEIVSGPPQINTHNLYIYVSVCMYVCMYVFMCENHKQPIHLVFFLSYMHTY